MQVTDARAALSVVEGAFTVRADGDVDVYLDTPEHTPLAASERHATLRIAGAGESDDADDFTAAVELDADGLEALADALADVTATEGDR